MRHTQDDEEVSVHGWWKDRSGGACPEYADVEVWLQAHWCDIFFACRWITLANAEKRIWAADDSPV